MSDSINDVVPGAPLSEEQRAKLAKDNADATTEAHRMAQEQMERDRQEGRGEPAVTAVAGLLKKQLEGGEFQQKSTNATPNQPTSGGETA